ncbi:DUF4839 domain-containing protein [uncultured Microbacterium sp.]|uniref:DUF4839 domain-containing protein n=1 Tax=uncultured Microbacterium sp. TaxID=191216 RepID=UPI0028D6504C|nr:DUF4839 domain-containing protein [uncultured Microbacterium sp.]
MAGKLTTELTLRRPKPKTPWIPLAALGGVVVVLVLILVTVNLTGAGKPADAPEASATAEPSALPSAASSAPSPQPITSPPGPETDTGPTVLSANNNAEFAALLGLSDYCSPQIATFASVHTGQTIEFDGSVGALANHDGARTRYDILLTAGNYSETASAGPAFQYRDVNTTNDLHWTDEQPDTVGVGDNLHVLAEIVEYEESTCLLLLEPVATAAR